MTTRTNFPLAYHITFGTYGTRLHGDPRGTVDRHMNQPCDPVIDTCEQWERMERDNLNFPPRVLTSDQMLHVERLIPEICIRGNWTLHTCAAGPDHVHVVLSANREGDDIRKWLKRWLGQSLAELYPLQQHETFWAECGSVKWVWTDDYLRRAIHYVHAQRAST